MKIRTGLSRLFLTGLFVGIFADQLIVQSEKLIEYTGCNATQQKMIVDAWYSAMEISGVVRGNINFNSLWAETEFLGYASRNQPQQSNLKAVLENAATFQLAYRWNWRAWKTHVRCDDWQSRCGVTTRNIAAYTNNPGSRVIPGTTTPTVDTINFCPRFFDKMPTCAWSMNRWGNSPKTEFKEDLNNYQCQGYALLHELFHLDSLSKVGSQGHITDLKVSYNNGQSVVSRNAYTPLLTKVLASWANNDVGNYVATNADNLAQYSLAKWVQYKTGLYPRFPTRGGLTQLPGQPPRQAGISTINNTLVFNETVLLPYICGPQIQTFDDLDGSCDDDEGDCANTEQLIIDALDPIADPAFIDEDSSDECQSQDYPSYILPSDPNLDCFRGKGIDVTNQSSVPQPFAEAQITNFCNLTKGIAMSNNSGDVLDMVYPVPATSFNLWFQAGWQIGDPTCTEGRTPDLTECNTQLSTILNGCDTDSITEKYGGTRVNDCITWTMFVEGVGAAPPDPGQPFSCTLLDFDNPTCSCSDGEVYPLDPSGGCGYSSPPLNRRRRTSHR